MKNFMDEFNLKDIELSIFIFYNYKGGVTACDMQLGMQISKRLATNFNCLIFDVRHFDDL